MQKLENCNAEELFAVNPRISSFIGRNGHIAATKRAPEHRLPRVGDIILYNENTDQMETNGGNLGNVDRGIGRVIGYCGENDCLLQIHVYRKPGFSYRGCFLSSDFRVGLYVYRKLSDYVYTMDRYGYRDLDIKNPHEDIAALFADDGNTVAAEGHQVYMQAVR